VNRSAVRATPEGKDLRIGLGFVRGWGEEIAELVVAEREKNGPFRSLPDFLRRTPAALKRPAIENLIWVGGFEDFGLTRRELLWQAGLWLGPETDPERTGGRDDHAQLEMQLPDPHAELPFADMTAEERMVSEYRMLRFSASIHPLALIRDQLPRGTISSGKLKSLPNGATVTLAGIVVARQRPQTAKGYVFVLFEDEDGPINVIVKPKIYQRDRTTIRMEPFVAVRGRLQKDGETVNVIAYEVKGLRLGSGSRPPSAREVEAAQSRAGSAPGDRNTTEEELFPSLPGTQEWWPDRGKFKKRDSAEQAGPASSPREGFHPDHGDRRRQEAQEEAATERRREKKKGRAPGSAGSGSRRGNETSGPPERPPPELPEVREWWGSPEEARKSPFAYLTALRQAPPGTKSWG
jgi:hypothetical protein